MESVQTTDITATDRINNALATLRSDMLDIRQQDVQLMQQLMCINDNIKTLTKRKRCSSKPLRKKLALVNDRMIFVNIDESTSDRHRRSFMSRSLTGSLSSIEGTSNSTEDLSSPDSDSDDSLCGTTHNH
ncbi:uncharacterized protein LOC110447667 [Mizuhopecten yessoensis]|uniref:Uncharacterized protein n=1 Tax=Mizuhopecten yessoensis TaxID=6573 RepID=A0A210QUR6_MIZYE|nr:uncharacterized protein LOC110447667 [Mizuhopecten yessoensis]OWF52474.1 hypothetical protein KP79_PYT06868 [Mizuhopecten yessoensis]